MADIQYNACAANMTHEYTTRSNQIATCEEWQSDIHVNYLRYLFCVYYIDGESKPASSQDTKRPT